MQTDMDWMYAQQILGNSCIWEREGGTGTGQGNLGDLLFFLILNPKQTDSIFIFIF